MLPALQKRDELRQSDGRDLLPRLRERSPSGVFQHSSRAPALHRLGPCRRTRARASLPSATRPADPLSSVRQSRTAHRISSIDTGPDTVNHRARISRRAAPRLSDGSRSVGGHNVGDWARLELHSAADDRTGIGAERRRITSERLQ